MNPWEKVRELLSSRRAVPGPGGHLRFGPFEMDPSTGELWREDAPVALAPQPTRLLRMLVERRGRLVTRDRIREEIWGETVVEFDQAINGAVRQIREALGDDAREPRYITTVPRRGYRFSAPVVEAGMNPARPVGEVRGASAGAAFGALAVVVGLGAWAVARVGGHDPTVVAVVPATTGSVDPAVERFTGSLTGALQAGLEDLPAEAVSVIPWSRRTRAGGDGLAAPSGWLADVDLAVESNVHDQDGGRVTVFVTKLPEGVQVWTRRFSVDVAQGGSATRMITDAVMDAVAANLPGGTP